MHLHASVAIIKAIDYAKPQIVQSADRCRIRKHTQHTKYEVYLTFGYIDIAAQINFLLLNFDHRYHRLEIAKFLSRSALSDKWLEIIENNGNYFIDPNPSRTLLNEVRSFKKSKKLIYIFNTSLRENDPSIPLHTSLP